MLAGLPLLQDLTLFRVYIPQQRVAETTCTVRLPHLVSLSMGEARLAFIHVLEHLVFPPTTELSFTSDMASHRGDRAVARAIRNRILTTTSTNGVAGSISPPKAIRSIRLSLHFDNGFWEIGTRRVNISLFMSSAAGLLGSLADEWIDTMLDFKIPTTEDRLRDVIDELMIKMDLSEVTSMYITSPDKAILPSDLMTMLRTVPNLRALAVGSLAISSLADVALLVSERNGGASPYGVAAGILLSLEVLRLVETPFADCCIHREEHEGPLLRSLLDALKTLKQDAGLMLPRLEIDRPVNFTLRDHEAIVAADVARVVDVLDFGRSSCQECRDDNKHPEESEGGFSVRMQRICDEDAVYDSDDTHDTLDSDDDEW